MLHGHGDNAYTYGREILADFSSNVWYGLEPPGLKDHIFRRWNLITRYPEVIAESLAAKIAAHHALDTRNILVSAGSTESIYLIAQLFRGNTGTAILIPSFSEYEDACRIHDHQLHFIQKHGRELVIGNHSLLWLTNPNNPTGDSIAGIEKLVRLHPGTTFVLDEAFIEFTTAISSAMPYLLSLPNLIILRSLTKAYAIPGLRLGYIAASAVMIEKLQSIKMPWTVNSLALVAGHYIFDNYHELSLPLSSLLADTTALANGLRRLGFTVCPSDTHFLLCRTPAGNAASLQEYLLDQHGILVRNASNFRGLGPDHFRIAAGPPEKNLLLINALTAWSPQ